MIRLGFLQQNAFHAEDTCVPLKKQFLMMDIILYLYDRARDLVTKGMPVSVLKESSIFDRVISVKYDVANHETEKFLEYRDAIDEFYQGVLEKNG